MTYQPGDEVTYRGRRHIVHKHVGRSVGLIDPDRDPSTHTTPTGHRVQVAHIAVDQTELIGPT